MKYAADSVVFCSSGMDFKVLVIRRKNPPFQDFWCFPGGFIDQGEDPVAAAVRELAEETGLSQSSGDAIPLAIRKRVDRDPRGACTSYPYLFYLEKIQEVNAADDALEAKWLSLDEIDEMGFDHGAILCEALGKLWGAFPNSQESLKSIQLPLPYSSICANDMTFYGGSFNPWHDGHQACIDACPSKHLVILPDSNPFKADQKQSWKCFFKNYKELLTKTKRAVYPGFYGMEESNPSSGWLPKVEVQEKWFLMGADSFVDLPRWKDPQTLLGSLTGLYVVPRDCDQDKFEQTKNWLRGLNLSLKVEFLGHHEHEHVSSTQIRSTEKSHQ